MCKITFVFACLACTSGAWRVQLPASSPTRHTQASAEALKNSRAAVTAKLFGEDDAQKTASVTVNEFFDPHFGESRRKRDVVYDMFNKVADHAVRQKNKVSNFFVSAAGAPMTARNTDAMDWFDDMINDKSMMKTSEGDSPQERRRKRDIAKEMLKSIADKKLGADYLRVKAEEAEAETKAREEWMKKELATSA